MDANMMIIMAHAIGDVEAAEKYKSLTDEIKNRIRNDFFTSQAEFKIEILNTMQTPALFALMNNIFDDEKKQYIIERLKDNFHDKGNCLSTGFLGTSILMNTLTENGMSDIAYELLFQHKNPSWLYSIDNGATTIWERWDSYTIEKGMAASGMNSFNHYAYGSVCEWIWKTCAGISADPLCPGFKHIVLKPIPDERLGFIDAEYNSPAGLIRSVWEYNDDKWNWEFSIPEGASASVTIPGETTSIEYEAGTYEISLPLTNVRKEISAIAKHLKVKEDGTVEVTKLADETILVYNIEGIKVLSTSNDTFNMSSLQQGLYIVKVGEKMWKIRK